MTLLDPGDRKPTFGYLLSLCAGCVGLPLDAISLGAMDQARRGGDPTDAISGVGTAAVIVMFVLAFAMRLIFWPKATPIIRTITRASLVVGLGASILGAVTAVGWLAVGGGGRGGVARFLALWFATPAVLCQVGTVVWLVRYRRV